MRNNILLLALALLNLYTLFRCYRTSCLLSKALNDMEDNEHAE